MAALTPKAVRAKITYQTKTKEPSQKNPPKTKSLKDCPSIGTKSGSSTCSACTSVKRSGPSLSTKKTKPTA